MVDLLTSGQATGTSPVPLTPPPACEHCILGKQTRNSVPTVREGERARRKLGIVHVDLLEHPDHISASGNHYVMHIIDDFSSHAWSIPLTAKSEAFPQLQAWECAHKLETGTHVGTYHSDNGELHSHAMRNWLAS